LIERLPYHLIKFYRQRRATSEPLALITVLNTEGSTYSKAGSQMLVDSTGDFQGMLSGGCLEGDLAERSRKIMTNGMAEIVTYDLRGDDDVFGLGVGCEGALRIYIQPLSAESNYEPFDGLIRQLDDAAFVEFTLAAGSNEVGVAKIHAPLRLLILGAGIDAKPLVLFADELGWQVSLSDHRPAAIERMGSCPADAIECVPVADMASYFDLKKFDAVIVMSHNLAADREYLRALSDSPIKFIGLLGPPHRRDRLLGEIGSDADKLAGRLHGPVGKQVGGRGPAAIALEIVAELQANFSLED
jgi:xanthine dehydrogenase accessory factor